MASSKQRESSAVAKVRAKTLERHPHAGTIKKVPKVDETHDRRYGFVSPDRGCPDLFFHATVLIEAMVNEVHVGMRVRFAAYHDPCDKQGRPNISRMRPEDLDRLCNEEDYDAGKEHPVGTEIENMVYLQKGSDEDEAEKTTGRTRRGRSNRRSSRGRSRSRCSRRRAHGGRRGRSSTSSSASGSSESEESEQADEAAGAVNGGRVKSEPREAPLHGSKRDRGAHGGDAGGADEKYSSH